MIAAPPQSLDRVQRYFGKYRGTVLNNLDPLRMGRLIVSVPAVLGALPSTWALPCTPLGGMQNGMFAVPTIGAGVWVEFEQGDPDFPLWVGCFYGSAAEVPTMAQNIPAAIPGITFQTVGQNGLTISDVPGPLGGIEIRSRGGATISVNELGIVIQNGLGAVLKLTGPTVDVNDGALTIT